MSVNGTDFISGFDYVLFEERHDIIISTITDQTSMAGVGKQF